MDFQLKTLSIAQAAAEKADVLIVLVAPGSPEASDPLSQLAAAAVKAGDLPDKPEKPGKLLALYGQAGVAARRVLLVALGDGKPQAVRSAVAAAVGAAKASNPKRLVIAFAQAVEPAGLAAAVLAAADASYVYSASKSKAEPRSLRQVLVGVPEANALRPAFERASATVLGIELAKEWGNRPANYCTPSMLADAATELAKLPKLKVEVLGPKEVAKLGMGSFSAVAQGSSEPLRFIVLRYNGGPKDQAPVVLVGKGITFDTGGVSLKPAAEMDEMKFDMCGAASVLGVFRTLGELQPAVNVVGLVPSCENMNDGHAVKPGDVVTSMSGQTIEVLNTDAEGRLILCDALTYAKRFAPAAVIDIATLTGACVVALGNIRSGMFSADEALAGALEAAGEAAQDRCWRLPLDDDYAEGLKSNFADVANIAGRAGGAITAAKFLQRFTADYPWAHLDIAGTAWKSGAAKGSTGRPVGLLLEYILARAGRRRRQGQGRQVAQGAVGGVTEIDGHYNMPDKVGYACRLLRKAVAAHGARLVVIADGALLDTLDQALWKLSPTDFVAHCRAGDEPHVLERSPVVLADGSDGVLPDRPILVNLGAELPPRFERFERLIDIVGSEEADKLAGRARWRHYKDRGYAIRTHPYGGGAS